MFDGVCRDRFSRRIAELLQQSDVLEQLLYYRIGGVVACDCAWKRTQQALDLCYEEERTAGREPQRRIELDVHTVAAPEGSLNPLDERKNLLAGFGLR
jgi:hypothetical protein